MLPEPDNLATYHVFLASPGDMEDERKIVREFFDNYNRNIANSQGLEFKLVDWENHTSSGLGRPQQLINKQTLYKYKDSLVLLIGLLGQRFGTPTGEYQSGTEEEFQTVVDFRREQSDFPEIKWFFRKQWGRGGVPTDPDALNDASKQMASVIAFKDRLTHGEPPHYIANFPRTDDFEAIFRADLERWLNDLGRSWHKKDTPTQKLPQTIAKETPYLNIWLRLLALECARLPLEVLDARQGLEVPAEPIRLPDVFVPLKAVAPPKAWQEGENPEIVLRQPNDGDSSEPQPVVDLLENQRQAVIIGDPGSGKSALVNQLTWQLLEPEADKNLPRILQGRTPIRIILARVDIPAGAEKGQAVWIWDALKADIREKLETSHDKGDHAQAVIDALLQKILSKPGGVILFDGLDEVPTAGQRRARLLQAIEEFIRTVGEHCRIIATARPYAYSDPRYRLSYFTAYVLTPFDADQREQFINNWYDAARARFGLTEQDLKQRLPDLLQRIEQQAHLTELAQRPLLLTLIATLHASGGRLPEDRAQLYADSVNLLLYQWRRNATRYSDGQTLHLDENMLLNCLQHLAYLAHKSQQQQSDHEGTAEINHQQLIDAFDPLLKSTLSQDDLVAYLQQHAGILIAREHNRYAFPHRSFQEYLAMGWLTAQSVEELSQAVCSDPIWWREVFLLAVTEQRQKRHFGISYIDSLSHVGESEAGANHPRLWVLAGLGLMELGLTGLDNQDYINKRQPIRESLVDIINKPDTLDIAERAEAGRVLAHIGDPRAGVSLTAEGLPDIDWIQIPAGEIMLEKGAGTFPVEMFYLARYAITNTNPRLLWTILKTTRTQNGGRD